MQTKNILKEKINRSECYIESATEGRNGTVIIELKCSDKAEEVHEKVVKKIGEEYVVKIPTPTRARLKIVGAGEFLTENELTATLNDQNETLNIKSLRLVTYYKSERNNNTTYSYIVEVEPEVHSAMLRALRVNIGWDKCKVIECFGIIRCFKCCKFGHKSTECTNEEKCSKCAGNHATVRCTSPTICCANCVSINAERKLNLDCGHYAYSLECAVYKKLLLKKRQQIESYINE